MIRKKFKTTIEHENVLLSEHMFSSDFRKKLIHTNENCRTKEMSDHMYIQFQEAMISTSA